MARKEITTPLDLDNMNRHNENFEELYKQISETTRRITQELWDVLQEYNTIRMKEPVQTFADLPESDENNTLRMVLDEQKVYAYSIDKWIEFQYIDLDPYTPFKEELQGIINTYEQKIIGLTDDANNAQEIANQAIAEVEDAKQKAIEMLEDLGAKDIENWQKYSLTEPDGDSIYLNLDSNIDTMHALPVGFYYTVNTPIERSSSTAGFLKVEQRGAGIAKHITFRPYNSTQIWLKRYYKEWLEWEQVGADRKTVDITSNSSMPPKITPIGNAYSLINKMSEKEIVVYQKANKGYLKYTLKKGNGGAGYGTNYDLLRLQKVEPISDAIVFIQPHSPKSGKVTRVWDQEGGGSAESAFLDTKEQDNTKRYSTSGSELQVYAIAPNSSATYDLRGRNGKNANVAFFSRGGHTTSEDYEILVDGAVAETGTMTAVPYHSHKRVDVNLGDKDSQVELTIKNKGSRDLYISAINLFHLNEYEGQDIDSYVAFGANRDNFIDSAGASDYALQNLETGLQFGSYHGGEVVNSAKMIYASMLNNIYRENLFNIADVPVGIYGASQFKIIQETTLIERATMYSVLDFSESGTINMKFSYNVIDGQTPIPLIDFWTGLTCTSPKFNKLKVPKLITFPEIPKKTHVYFPATEGYVIQTNDNERQELHIRHNRFDDLHVTTETAQSISDQEQYRKYYYAPIRSNSDDRVAPLSLQFSKGLDFYIL
ncbi:pyocin knob domain-containing protein [Mammaliicoccus sciuri]|uniref:pyocin knob domain-containing protein n=1 Tax=Mammaliicoccus sciuri TaxID=1296 RepID=UPI003A944F81